MKDIPDFLIECALLNRIERIKSDNRIRDDGKWEVRSGVKECAKALIEAIIEAIMNSKPKFVWVIRTLTREFAQIEFYWEISNKRREARLLIQNESQNLAVRAYNFLEFRVSKFPKYHKILKHMRYERRKFEAVYLSKLYITGGLTWIYFTG